MGYQVLSSAPEADVLVDSQAALSSHSCAKHRHQPPQITILGSGHTASKSCCELVNKQGQISLYINTYIPIFIFPHSAGLKAHSKAAVRSCSETGKSQVVSSYGTAAAISDPQGTHKGSLPAEPQQCHCYNMEFHKGSHLEIIILITAWSPDARLAPLSPAHLWLQYMVCSSSKH